MKKSNHLKHLTELTMLLAKSKALILMAIVLLLFSNLNAQTPIPGSYNDTTVVTGQCITISPTVAPVSTTKAVAFTNTNFTGLLTINPTTGVVTVTNAMQAGIYTITVKFTNGSAAASTSFTLTVSKPISSQGYFEQHSPFVGGGQIMALEVGDFNNDGNQDIVLADVTNHIIAIKTGNGIGGFGISQSVASIAYVRSLTIGDFNEDGNQDIAVLDAKDSICILLGDGSLGFSLGLKIFNGGWSIKVGDFNNDGHQDLATCNYVYVNILLGNGSGNFSAPTSVVTGSGTRNLVVCDLNNDGNQDLVTGSYSYADSIAVLIGNGSGGFSVINQYHTGLGPDKLALADLNNDGNQDIVTANSGGNANSISYLIGNGNGGFSSNTELHFGGRPQSIAVADFNGDGNQDLAVSMETPHYGVDSIYFGDGNGNFAGGTHSDFWPTGLFACDFNKDGNLDILSYNNYYNKKYNTIVDNIWLFPGGEPDPCTLYPCNIGATAFATYDDKPGCDDDGSILIRFTGNYHFSKRIDVSGYGFGGSYYLDTAATKYRIENLKPGKYIVKVWDKTCCHVDFVINIKCAPPSSGFATTFISANSARLNWDKSDCADGYRVDYRQQGTSIWNQIGVKTNVGRKTINGLQPSTTYEWRVSTKCNETDMFKYIDHSATQTFTTTPLRIGEEQILNSTDIILYPNPAPHYLTVSFENVSTTSTLKVINTLGKTVIEKQLADETNAYELQLDVSQLQNGFYILQMETDDGISRSRFIKN